MTFGSRRVIVGVVATACVWILSVTLVTGQAAPPQAPVTAAEDRRMSEAVFKNVQVLRGIPVDEFMGTMGVFSAALGFPAKTATRRHPMTGRITPPTRARGSRWRGGWW